MQRTHSSKLGSASAGLLKGSLDGPSKTITVEPIQVPAPAPARRIEEPDPERERPRGPEHPREPTR
jgi:hypothetical protein